MLGMSILDLRASARRCAIRNKSKDGCLDTIGRQQSVVFHSATLYIRAVPLFARNPHHLSHVIICHWPAFLLHASLQWLPLGFRGKYGWWVYGWSPFSNLRYACEVLPVLWHISYGCSKQEALPLLEAWLFGWNRHLPSLLQVCGWYAVLWCANAVALSSAVWATGWFHHLIRLPLLWCPNLHLLCHSWYVTCNIPYPWHLPESL